MRRAVFLDRDGTINEEASYIARVEDLRIYPFAAEAIRRLNEANYLVIVVTNQSGVGRGIIPPHRLDEIHRALKDSLSASKARIDAIYFCPHLPADNCDCRKPAPGLVLRAIREFTISPSASYFVGDKPEDILVARASGVTPILVRTGYGRETETLAHLHPVAVVDTIAEAVHHILTRNGSPLFQPDIYRLDA
ncbi:MAG: D-glycero-beta-D-manno-heptose 1,7-bisphosphate 7-phosphatase [bacterium JZ-2024 1]